MWTMRSQRCGSFEPLGTSDAVVANGMGRNPNSVAGSKALEDLWGREFATVYVEHRTVQEVGVRRDQEGNGTRNVLRST